MIDLDDIGTNPSSNRRFDDIVQTRRTILKGGLAGFGVTLAAPLIGACSSEPMRSAAAAPAAGLTFKSVPLATTDRVTVPDGYSVEVLWSWGDPIDGRSPAFRTDAGNTTEEQALQAGMHHDGMQFFALDGSANRGLLCMNHEYTDDGLLHSDGMKTWSAEKVRKSQAAHGVSVVEVALQNGRWIIVPSKYARRITASTPIRVSGPAAGHALMRTAADPKGTTVLGTFNNCAMGATPWGTYLTCEENINGYFVNASSRIPSEQARMGITRDGGGYRWHEFDARFDAAAHPNEPNRHGWVVEIDPSNPDAPAVKRTALGRMKHEGATVTLAADGRPVVYLGDDERNEYIYKFVAARKMDPNHRAANLDLLDEGTLYVGAFNDDGSGDWIALEAGSSGLLPSNGFADQATVLIRARQAADRAGATVMDRPEWIAVHPTTGEVYVSLTNNSSRGTATSTDRANPRANNLFGHIVRWNEAGGDAAALKFKWGVYVLAGPTDGDPKKSGSIKGDVFGSPDGLRFDSAGILWIQTDVSTSTLNQKEYAGIGNNMMLASDIRTGEIRRFLTGPSGCEITGLTWTTDRSTMFVNIQHPCETSSERGDPDKPTAVSSWPANQFPALPAGRPRSATIVIRRVDGGPVNA
ncbi:PhoX family phosphatase [soil metagenome]